MSSLRLLSVLLMLGLVYGCDDIPNPFVNYYEKAIQAREAGDLEAAIKWYTKAAEQGDAKAQFFLGVMYDNGEVVAQDYKQAVYWYTKAAEQGLAEAQHNLASMYDNGEGVAQDYEQAVYWFTKAAEQGDASAQSNLGWMYRSGRGVPEDIVKAHMWINISAGNGLATGQAEKKIIERRMSPYQIEKAQEMARECVAKNYKGC